MRKRWILIPIILSLSACSHPNQGPYPGKTVDWYKTHEPQAEEQAKWCLKTGTKSASCKLVMGPVAHYFARHSFLGGAGKDADQNLM